MTDISFITVIEWLRLRGVDKPTFTRVEVEIAANAYALRALTIVVNRVGSLPEVTVDSVLAVVDELAVEIQERGDAATARLPRRGVN